MRLYQAEFLLCQSYRTASSRDWIRVVPRKVHFDPVAIAPGSDTSALTRSLPLAVL